jgi:hypothetical protein
MIIKKIIIVILSLVAALILINFGLNYWLNKQLPKMITDKNSTSYTITYKDLKIDLLSKNIKASSIVIAPKPKQQDSLKEIKIYTKIATISIEDFNVWDILFNDRIKAHTVTISNPNVVLFKDEQQQTNASEDLSSHVVKPFQKIIIVSNIILKHGSLKIVKAQSKKPLLTIANLNLKLDGIVVTDQLLKKKIPFSFQEYAIATDSSYYRINDSYHITTKEIVTTNKALNIKDFRLIPDYSRQEFTKRLTKEKDLFTVHSKLIKISNMDWGFKNDKLFFKANSVLLDQLSANIYRNKLPEDDLSTKPLYSKLLRDLQFPLQVDTLLVRNSLLVYEEEIDFTKGPGILRFNNFNLKATNIQSGYLQKKLADVTINIDCKFMKDSPFKLNWKFNVLDQKERFKLHGVVSNLQTNDLSSFTKPYINASTKGTFDKLEFRINGNNYNSFENASLKYHDLKVTLYRKAAPEKKSVLKSALANLIVKNDSDGKTIATTATVERVPEKSFFNFLWLNIVAVLKQILI